MPARILIADDHDVVREGVKTILKARPEWDVCGEAADGEETVNQVKQLHPDVVILDITMPRLSGLEAAQKLARISPDTRVLIFTMHDSRSVVRAVKQVGARGVVIKAFAARDLIRALELVLAGGTFFGPDDISEAKEKPAGPGKSMLFLFFDSLPGTERQLAFERTSL